MDQYLSLLFHIIFDLRFFKLPYMAKPGAEPMHPRSFRGSARGWMDYDAEEILHHALAHHPGVHNNGKPLLTCEPIGIRKFFKQAGSVKLVDVADPEKPTPLEEAAIPLITNTLKKQNPGSKLVVSFCRKGSNAKSVFYVKFDGLHTCPLGRQHKNNNGTINVVGKKMWYNCFSLSCKNSQRLEPDLPFSLLPEPTQEEPNNLA